MRSDRLIFALSVLIAAGVHALAYVAADRWYQGYARGLQDEVARELRRQQQAEQIVIVQLEPSELIIGDPDGDGDAANPIDLPAEMTAPEGPLQAPLSRDPQHTTPSDTPQPDQPTAQLVSPPTTPTPLSDRPSTPPPPPPPVSYATPQPEAREEAPPPSPPLDVQPAPAPPQPIPVETASVDAPAPAPPSPSPSAVAADASGDPLPQADSDSDPFTTENSVVFRSGKVDVRFGRKIKAVRPHIRLAGRWDLPALQYPDVELRIHTDEHGNVRSAEITKSSGSINIDQPVLVAIYDWWFEPPRDANGNPKPDTFPFTIRFR